MDKVVISRSILKNLLVTRFLFCRTKHIRDACRADLRIFNENSADHFIDRLVEYSKGCDDK